MFHQTMIKWPSIYPQHDIFERAALDFVYERFRSMVKLSYSTKLYHFSLPKWSYSNIHLSGARAVLTGDFFY